jgi:hypothetical protein
MVCASMKVVRMTIAVRLAALILLSGALLFAGTWSGTLVDSKCFESAERNVNPNDTQTAVDRDMNAEIRYCAAHAKTKSFTVVQSDGSSFRLDAAGNAKAAELVRTTGRKSLLAVTVSGEMTGNTVKVAAISNAR